MLFISWGTPSGHAMRSGCAWRAAWIRFIWNDRALVPSIIWKWYVSHCIDSHSLCRTRRIRARFLSSIHWSTILRFPKSRRFPFVLLLKSGRLDERLIDGASTHCLFFTGVRKPTSTVRFEAAASMTNWSDMCILGIYTSKQIVCFVQGLLHELSKWTFTKYSSAYCAVEYETMRISKSEACATPMET